MASPLRPQPFPLLSRVLLVGALAGLVSSCEFFLGAEADTSEVDTVLSLSLPLAEPAEAQDAGELTTAPVFVEVSLREVSEGTGGGSGVSRAVSGNIVGVRINRIDHVIDDPNNVPLAVLPMSIRAGALGTSYADAEEVGETRELQARGFGTQRANVTPEQRVNADDVMSAGVFLLGAQPRYQIPDDYDGGTGTATTTLTFDLTVTVE